MAKNIAVFVSGNGSNLQAIIDNYKADRLRNINLKLVFSNHKDAFGIKRAQKAGIETVVMELKKNESRKGYFKRVYNELVKRKIDYICLAGFMLILPPEFVKKYENKILNIHPALLPKFGGPGMFGLNVHKAVMEAKEKYSGATVHLVNSGVDTGKIILQKKVRIYKNDNPEKLARRVLKIEHRIYSEAINQLLSKIT